MVDIYIFSIALCSEPVSHCAIIVYILCFSSSCAGYKVSSH